MNKIKFLLLLLPLTTQCMKRNNAELTVSQSITMQELQNKRDELKQSLNEIDGNHDYWNYGIRNCSNVLFLSCTYHQNLHKKTYGEIDKRRNYCVEFNQKVYGPYNIDNLKNINNKSLKKLNLVRIKNYSGLGSATMAEKVSYKEKKEFVQKLLNLGFTPTSEDKELALLATYEEFGSSIIQKKLLLQNISFLLEMGVPQEIKNYIALLMFEAELLF